MRHGLHFLVVTFPAALPDLVQDEVSQTDTASCFFFRHLTPSLR
jgi:hypothetical protein